MELIGVICAFVFGIPLAIAVAVQNEPVFLIPIAALVLCAWLLWSAHNDREREKLSRLWPGGKVRY